MKHSFTLRLWVILLISLLLILPSGISINTHLHKNQTQQIPAQSPNIKPSPQNVYTEISTLSEWYRYLDTPGHRAAEDYIYSRFDSFGLNVTRQEYTVQRQDGNARGVNVLGLLEGTLQPNKWLVIGGHYDANQYATHAAYDNAAGAGTVIELARFFTEYYQTAPGPEISILFIAWDSEEGGGAGSAHFVNNIPPEISIVACINLDMYSLNYPIRNSIPGSSEEYFKLYLYTSPVSDFSGYSDYNFNESTIHNFSVFQELLKNITYTTNNYPEEWVCVIDDTAVVSDHAKFIRESIPAVWFRGMHEYPRDTGDINERNFKHTPLDTLDTMERYAGGKAELLKGINTGLTIAYQLAIEVINLTTMEYREYLESSESEEPDRIMGVDLTGWFLALIVALIIFGIFLYYWPRWKREA